MQRGGKKIHLSDSANAPHQALTAKKYGLNLGCHITTEDRFIT